MYFQKTKNTAGSGWPYSHDSNYTASPPHPTGPTNLSNTANLAPALFSRLAALGQEHQSMRVAEHASAELEFLLPGKGTGRKP